jgi:tetratricopeptide (TPR) repeat protein
LEFEVLLNQANCYSTRFDISVDINDADRAIQNYRKLQEASNGSTASINNNIAIVYRSRYEKLHNLEDLEKAERHAKEAVNGTEGDDKNLPTRLLNLAVCYCMLFEEDGDVHHVNSALQDLEKASNLSRAWGLDCLPQVLSKQARAIYLRYMHKGDRQDMQIAISLAQQALDVARSDEVEDTRLEIVRQLAVSLSVTDSQRRSVEDLEAAILRGEMPVNLIATDQEGRS